MDDQNDARPQLGCGCIKCQHGLFCSVGINMHFRSLERKITTLYEENVMLKAKLKELVGAKQDILLIWNRDDRSEKKPSYVLCGEDLDDLAVKFGEYLKEHRDEDDWMEDEQYFDFCKDPKNLILDRAPELNCAYIVKHIDSSKYK